MSVKTYRIALSLVIVLVIAVTALVLWLQKPQQENTPGGQPLQAAYCLKEYQEKIGVYRRTEAEPFMTIDVYVSTLPAADQQELRADGIQVENDSKLQTVIEDFGS